MYSYDKIQAMDIDELERVINTLREPHNLEMFRFATRVLATKKREQEHRATIHRLDPHHITPSNSLMEMRALLQYT
jgi:hypothetical protein